jgi:hypothetical protein
MDCLPPTYVFAAFMALYTVGQWRFLGHNPESMVVDCRHFQTLLVANGFGGYLADVVGSPTPKTDRRSLMMA